MADGKYYTEKQRRGTGVVGSYTLLLGGKEGLCLSEKMAYELRLESGK